MGANNLISGLRGPVNIVFEDGQHIRFGYPSYKLGGTVMGDRTIEGYGCCIFEDLTNKRKAVILTNSFKKTGWIRSSSTGSKDEISGIIYDAKHITGDKESIKRNYGKDMDHVHDLKHLKDVKKEICAIEGSWLYNLYIDGKKYWDVDELVPTRQKP